jgi:hypothetical protein
MAVYLAVRYLLDHNLLEIPEGLLLVSAANLRQPNYTTARCGGSRSQSRRSHDRHHAEIAGYRPLPDHACWAWPRNRLLGSRDGACA